MTQHNANILIIGAGLTGLTLAYYLEKRNIPYTILEARDRIGGRIYTKENTNATTIELGATWFAKQHTEILKLLKELNLELFEQILGETAIYEPISTNPPQIVTLPKNQEPSYRLKGGTQQLTNTLVQHLKSKNIILNQPVISIAQEKEGLLVRTNNTIYKAQKVISTLPPHLFNQSITITPQLPHAFHKIVEQTHTWMGESIKVGLTFETPFWREKNLSGTIFSNVGPIPEMYDHSNEQDNLYALKGFLNGNYYKITSKERLELILNQLEKYYGKQVRKYINYEELVWKKETYTSTEYNDLILPHQNNGDIVFHETYLNNKLYIAGTETHPQFSGYMEGAVRSAQTILNKLIS